MKKYKLQKVVPYLLISSMLLTGCAKNKEIPCTEPKEHVHLYTKENENGIFFTTYFDSEEKEVYGFTKSPEYIEVSEKEKEAYNLLTEHGLFNGLYHWDYLYREMYYNHDFMEYYYEYITSEPFYSPDGTKKLGDRLVTHSGWTNNVKADHLTGKCRVCHHYYYGYRLVEVEGHYELEKSPLVDDIRDILIDFPFVSERCYTMGYCDVELTPDLMNRVDASSFTFFTQPDLSNAKGDKLILQKK